MKINLISRLVISMFLTGLIAVLFINFVNSRLTDPASVPVSAAQMQEPFCAKSGKVWDEKTHTCASSAPTRGEMICSDAKGTIYRTNNPSGAVVLESPGNADIFYETVNGIAEYSDQSGVDWSVMENCRVVFLYYNSPEVKSVALFAPQGFNPKSLFKSPYMGAKKIKVTQTASELSIEVLR